VAADMGGLDDLPFRLPSMRRAGEQLGGRLLARGHLELRAGGLQACYASMPDGASLRASQPVPAQRAVERSAHQPAACAASSAPWMASEKKGLEI
jgi:hypothetical protein